MAAISCREEKNGSYFSPISTRKCEHEPWREQEARFLNESTVNFQRHLILTASLGNQACSFYLDANFVIFCCWKQLRHSHQLCKKLKSELYPNRVTKNHSGKLVFLKPIFKTSHSKLSSLWGSTKGLDTSFTEVKRTKTYDEASEFNPTGG